MTFCVGLKLISAAIFAQTGFTLVTAVEDPFLPKEHILPYLNQFPQAKNDVCAEKSTCAFSESDKSESHKCWGYEDSCQRNDALYYEDIKCDLERDIYTDRPKKDIFFEQADFGYVLQRRRSFMSICEPLSHKDSSLVCTSHLEHCVGRGIRIDFSDIPNRHEILRYKMDVLTHGQIGGHCLLHQDRLQDNLDRISPLQSWGPELRNFVEIKDDLNDGGCDVSIEKPTFVMKLDASVNMYHHFCDFFNLYASLHLNSTHPNMFSRDVNILIWENQPYYSSFGDVWQAFTKNPILNLNSFGGKTVCFRNVVFPLLPRMVFGLFYNTPLISGCENSGLFRAFSEFIPHRLGIPAPAKPKSKLQVTIISRTTRHRRILNENELVSALEVSGEYHVILAKFTHNTPYIEQLRIIRKTDILIGIHGAGLTHLLFLPYWAVLFELYDCADPNCYGDLARLRGVKHISWTNPDLIFPDGAGEHPTDPSKPHAKFANYAFDVDEFQRKVREAATHVWEQVAQKNVPKDEL